MIILAIILPFALKNIKEFNKYFATKDGKIIEDERQLYIKEQAGYMAYGITLALIIYFIIAIITLRNIYPQYQIIAYSLFILIIISFIIYGIATIYFNKKYS